MVDFRECTFFFAHACWCLLDYVGSPYFWCRENADEQEEEAPEAMHGVSRCGHAILRPFPAEVRSKLV